jgi:hypothetical protein
MPASRAQNALLDAVHVEMRLRNIFVPIVVKVYPIMFL